MLLWAALTPSLFYLFSNLHISEGKQQQQQNQFCSLEAKLKQIVLVKGFMSYDRIYKSIKQRLLLHIYITLLVCLFVSNKRQNGWTISIVNIFFLYTLNKAKRNEIFADFII